MSTSHSWMVYLTTILLSAILFYEQNKQFEIWYPHHPRSVADQLFYLTVVLNELFYIYFAAYPIMYAVLLRSENGVWPSSVQVWGSRRMIAQERDIGGGESLVRGWWCWGAMLREYTFYGNLCQEVSKNTVFDLEKGEKR